MSGRDAAKVLAASDKNAGDSGPEGASLMDETSIRVERGPSGGTHFRRYRAATALRKKRGVTGGGRLHTPCRARATRMAEQHGGFRARNLTQYQQKFLSYLLGLIPQHQNNGTAAKKPMVASRLTNVVIIAMVNAGGSIWVSP